MEGGAEDSEAGEKPLEMGLITLLPHIYLDAGIYGTDEEDVGKDDEDTDVDPEHDRGAAGDAGINNLAGGFLPPIHK